MNQNPLRSTTNMMSSTRENITSTMVVLLLLTIIASPLYVIRFTLPGNLPTTLLEVLILLTTSAWIVWIWRNHQHYQLPPLPRAARLVLGMIVTATILASFVAVDLFSALGIARAYILEPLLIFFITLDVLRQKSIQLRGKEYATSDLVYKAFLVCILWISTIAVSQMLFKWPIITPHQFDRAHAIFNNGNALALLVGPVLAVLASRAILSGVRKTSRFELVVGGLGLIAFVGSQSTGGALALTLTVVMLTLQRLLTKNSRMSQLLPLLALCSVTILFGFLLLTIPRLTPQIENPWIRPGSTGMVRLCIWEGTRDLLWDHPILGSGLRSFQTVYSTSYTTCDAEPLVYPHNIFLNFWTELGILGLLGFMFLWIVLVKKIPLHPFCAYLVYTFLHGIVDVPFFKNDLSVHFFVAVALLIYTWMAEMDSKLSLHKE